MREMEVRIENLSSLRAAAAHSSSITPEQDAAKKIMEWATTKGLIEKSGIRLFGRNTYPTEKPQTHGYEFYLTIPHDIKTDGEIATTHIPGGKYAVLRFKNLSNMDFAWKKLWTWIEQNGHEHAVWQKTTHGWAGGFEEQVNWQEQKPPTEWIFDLWVKLEV